MATRARNPRRITLDFLRAVKRDLGRLITQWDTTGKVYLEPHEREAPHQWSRPREQHEYPENDPQAWARLADDAEELARNALALARYAREERADLLARQAAETMGAR